MLMSKMEMNGTTAPNAQVMSLTRAPPAWSSYLRAARRYAPYCPNWTPPKHKYFSSLSFPGSRISHDTLKQTRTQLYDMGLSTPEQRELAHQFAARMSGRLPDLNFPTKEEFSSSINTNRSPPTKSEYSRPLVLSQEGEKKYLCENCDRRFADPSNLQRHIRQQHVGARAHPCPECGKTFATSSGLKQHQHIHSSVKPFTCEVCHKSYTQFSNLCRHKRMQANCRSHMRCGTCKSLFPNISSLTKHRRFCTGAPFVNTEKVATKSPKSAIATSPKSEPESTRKSYSAIDSQSTGWIDVTKEQVSKAVEAEWSERLRRMYALAADTGSSQFSAARRFSQSHSSTLFSESSGETFARAKKAADAQVQCDNPDADSIFQATVRCTNPFPSSLKANSSRFIPANSVASFSQLAKHVAVQSDVCETLQNESAVSRPNSRGKERIWNPHLSPSTSTPKPTAGFELNTHPIKPNAAAAAVAAAYLISSAREKQHSSYSVANFPHSFPKMFAYETAKHTSEIDDQPLDLSMSFNKKTEMAKSPSTMGGCYLKSDELTKWRQSLNFLYEAGKQLGSSSSFPQVNTFPVNSTPLPVTHLTKPPYLSAFYSNLTSMPQNSVWQTQYENKDLSSKYSPLSGHTSPSSSFYRSNISSPYYRRLSFPSERYTCKFCYKDFPRSANLIRHERTHTGEQPYRCKYCDRSFSISSNLQRHVRNIHNKERPFPCDLCGKEFSQQANLERHLRNHDKMAYLDKARPFSENSSLFDEDLEDVSCPDSSKDEGLNSTSSNFSTRTSPCSSRRSITLVSHRRPSSTASSNDSAFASASPDLKRPAPIVFGMDHILSPVLRPLSKPVETTDCDSDASVEVYRSPNLNDSAVKSATEGLMRLVNSCTPTAIQS